MSDTAAHGRVRVRALVEADAEAFAVLAGERAIADTMVSIPHPLSQHGAREWIRQHSGADGRCAAFAVCAGASDELRGFVGIVEILSEHRLGEVSFWIGRPYWGQGLAQAAGRLALEYAFTRLGLNRLQAFHMVRNPASGRVLEQLGFSREGVLAERVYKWDRFEDVAIYGLLRARWLEVAPHPSQV